LAFSDLQQFMVLNPNDFEVYYRAAILLIMGGSYEDALQALSNSISLKLTPEAVILKSKCFVIMNNVTSAISELNSIKTPNLDVEILKTLESSNYNN
jgi:hypothetical protein